MALNAMPGPLVIIARAGMLTGGRVLHHLIHRLPDPRSTILFVGFQAEGTRGRQLLDGATTLQVFHRAVPVRARVQKIDGLSAHADAGELMRWMGTAEGNAAARFRRPRRARPRGGAGRRAHAARARLAGQRPPAPGDERVHLIGLRWRVMTSAAHLLRQSALEQVLQLSPAERIALALRLGDADLNLLCRYRGLDLDEAQRLLERQRQVGRRFSRCMLKAIS